MDSAIPSTLRCPRTVAQRMPSGWSPPYPAWASNAPVGNERLTIAYLGVQWLDVAARPAALADWTAILASFAHANGPAFFDRATYVDEFGYDTRFAIAYWDDERTYAAWSAAEAISKLWQDETREQGRHGLFREVFSPRIAHVEVLFSSPDQVDGAGQLLGGRSPNDIQEHAYWGSMRDRIPLSQTDALEPEVSVTLEARKTRDGRITSVGHDYIALIRSGQDWASTSGREREIYTERVEPSLKAGMDYLSTKGTEIGCYSNRYLRMLDDQDEAVEKSFGLSLWRSLAALEDWAEHHPTHLAIFDTFLGMAAELDFKLDLVLYHEVCVLRPDEQFYEYINCHPQTGLLKGLHPDAQHSQAERFR